VRFEGWGVSVSFYFFWWTDYWGWVSGCFIWLLSVLNSVVLGVYAVIVRVVFVICVYRF